MLTMFSTAKPFTGHSGVIQRNALKSWTLLDPKVEVILFGNEQGAAEVILVASYFRKAVELSAALFREFLTVGRRWDTKISDPCDFEQLERAHRLQSEAAVYLRTESATQLHHLVPSKFVGNPGCVGFRIIN